MTTPMAGTPAYLTDFGRCVGALPPRAAVRTDAPTLDLTGTWRFGCGSDSAPWPSSTASSPSTAGASSYTV